MSGAWDEVGDRVFVRRYPFFDQNVGVVIGVAGAIVIDTRTTHRQADELLRDLRALTDVVVTAVVNTHHHYDHTFGNARFAGSAIWGHARCAATLQRDGEAMRRRVMAELPELAAELGEVVITPPERTFTDAETLDLGDRLVELRHLGMGHTDNDIVAVVADAGVMFAGDLLENDAPPSFGDSYPLAWAETVADRLMPLVRDVVVPGHGRHGGRDFAERQAGELGLLAELIRSSLSGVIGIGEVTAASPYDAEATRVAIDRGRHEVEIPPHHPRGG